MSIPVVISTQNLQIQGAKYLKPLCHLLIFLVNTKAAMCLASDDISHIVNKTRNDLQ